MYPYHCQLLEAGKIVAITFAVVVLAGFAIFDVVLIWYCKRKSDENLVL